MRVTDKQIPGVMTAAYNRFLGANELVDQRDVRAAFYAGAAVAIASMDGSQAVVATLSKVAGAALGKEMADGN